MSKDSWESLLNKIYTCNNKIGGTDKMKEAKNKFNNGEKNKTRKKNQDAAEQEESMHKK